MTEEKNVYLGSGYNRRHHLRELRKYLEDRGYNVTSRWIDYDSRPNRSSPDWDEFAKEIAVQNMIDLHESDILVVDTDGIMSDNNGGVHTELGYFLATGKPIYLVGKRGNTFHWLPWVTLAHSYQDLLDNWLF